MRTLFHSGALLIAIAGMLTAAPLRAAEEARPASERELRTAMTRAEKRFFDLYNKLNEDARHEMSCQADDVAGSRMRKSGECRTRGEAAASEAAAKEYMRGLELSPAAATTGGSGAPDPALNQLGVHGTVSADRPEEVRIATEKKLQQERAEFEKHLQELLAENPQLQQRFDEYRLARSKYEAARQK
jgi:hypothetical protein